MSTTNPGGTFIVRTKAIDGSPIERRYDVPEKFNLGDGRTFKRMGVFPDASGMIHFDLKDPDILAALLLISMRRAGEPVTEADIDALDIGDVDFEAPEIAAEVPAAVPPVEAPVGAEANEVTVASPNGATSHEISGVPA